MNPFVQCWAQDPAARPTFGQAYQRVSAIMPDMMKVVQAWEEEGGLAVSVNDLVAVIDGRCVRGPVATSYMPWKCLLYTSTSFICCIFPIKACSYRLSHFS